MTRESPCSARQSPRRLRSWQEVVAARRQSRGRQVPRCASTREPRAGTAAGPASMATPARHDSVNPAVARMPHFQVGLPEDAGSERGTRVSRLTPGRPLGNGEDRQGRAGLPTPHRPGRRRSVADIFRRRRGAWSVSRASCLSCDSFLLESRSAPHGASVGRSWRWPRCCPRRRSCPSPGRRGWC